VQKLNQLEQS
jgi:hypothetical protein